MLSTSESSTLDADKRSLLGRSCALGPSAAMVVVARVEWLLDVGAFSTLAGRNLILIDPDGCGHREERHVVVRENDVLSSSFAQEWLAHIWLPQPGVEQLPLSASKRPPTHCK